MLDDGEPDRGRPGQVEMVCVLTEDPELGRDLPTSERAAARSAALAPVLSLDRGAPAVRIRKPAPRGHLGLLVLDGLIALQMRFGRISATEFLGPCDLLRPWALASGVEMAEARWETLTCTRLAVLDRDFATRVRPWPEITTALFDRYTDRLASQLLQSGLRKARRVDDRVWVVLWHFAARWGRVGPEGRVLDLPKVTGEALADIVGARRQSVSTALTTLTSRGVLKRRPDGGWVIPEKPPQLLLEGSEVLTAVS